MNIYLNRVKPYNPIGRNQTEDEAKVLDTDIYDIVSGFGIDLKIDGQKSSAETIVNNIISKYNQLNEN
jgi:hypothetical protein